jgi:4-amino-4-deoxy-L-arabinose transferase-like glycosyltransferase
LKTPLKSDLVDAPPAGACLPTFSVGRRAVFWRYLAIILIAKVLLEIFFFVGVARQYGEEDIFVSLALPSRDRQENYWHHIAAFREVTNWAEWKGDPSDMYSFRVAALYPNILFMRAFGASETSLTLWTALTGIGTVLLVGLIGRSLVDARTGLFSASVLALIPGHILYSARVDTDMPQLFYMCLGIFLLVPALQATTSRKQLTFAAASGLSFGFLYLAKLLLAFLVVGWAILVPFLLVALGDKETLLAPRGRLRQAMLISTVLLGGFALVFVTENCDYYFLSGHWLLHWRIMKCNAVNIESWRCAKFVTLGFIKLWLPPAGWEDLLAHTRMFRDSLFPVGWMSSIYSMPVHGWSGAVFLPALLVLPFLRISHRKLTLLIITGFVFYYLYQEFFWLYPTREGGMLNLTFVHKVHRFVFPCYIGISLCVGLALGSLSRFGQQYTQHWLRRIFLLAPVCLVLAFGAANCPGTRYFHTFLRESLADFRQVCRDLKAIAPNGAVVYVAAGSWPYYQLFQYPRHYEWKYFVDASEVDVRDGWGVVGGSLGHGLSPATYIEQYPEWLRPYYRGEAGPPAGWQLIQTKPSLTEPSIPAVRILKLPERDHKTDP